MKTAARELTEKSKIHFEYASTRIAVSRTPGKDVRDFYPRLKQGKEFLGQSYRYKIDVCSHIWIMLDPLSGVSGKLVGGDTRRDTRRVSSSAAPGESDTRRRSSSAAPGEKTLSQPSGMKRRNSRRASKGKIQFENSEEESSSGGDKIPSQPKEKSGMKRRNSRRSSKGKIQFETTLTE